MSDHTPDDPKLLQGQSIDWLSIPQIQLDHEVLLHHRQLAEQQENNPGYRAVGDPPNFGDWFRAEPGKKLVLHVEVTNTDLAQIVLINAFGGQSRIPGMDITNVVINPEAEDLTSRAQILRELADELEQKAQGIQNAFE